MLVADGKSESEKGSHGEASSSSSSSSSSTVVVDVVVKLSDGWSVSEIATIISEVEKLRQRKNGTGCTRADAQNCEVGIGHSATTSFRITMEGYVERMRARSARDTCSPVCLHAMEIQIEGTDDGWVDTSGGSWDGRGATCYQARPTRGGPWKEGWADENKHAENGDVIRHSSPTLRRNLDSTICLPASADPLNMESIATASATTSTSTICNSQSSSSHWRGAKDATRFPKFVKFLLDTFGGYDALSQRPVLDVAGGAGGLAFELSVRYAIDCVVVDTRPVRFNSKQMRHLAFRQQCVARLRGHAGQSPLARNLLNRFEVSAAAAAAGSNGGTDLQQCKTLLDSDDVLSRCGGGHRDAPNVGATDRWGDDDRQRLCAILLARKCSVIVGLHPDQATDHIIDVGLALQIPWAVVPCCVFPSLFRGRATRSGTPVRSYDDLCEYILAKDPNGRIQQSTLPFRGRNKVFHWMPSCGPHRTTMMGKGGEGEEP